MLVTQLLVKSAVNDRLQPPRYMSIYRISFKSMRGQLVSLLFSRLCDFLRASHSWSLTVSVSTNFCESSWSSQDREKKRVSAVLAVSISSPCPRGIPAAVRRLYREIPYDRYENAERLVQPLFPRWLVNIAPAEFLLHFARIFPFPSFPCVYCRFPGASLDQAEAGKD